MAEDRFGNIRIDREGSTGGEQRRKTTGKTLPKSNTPHPPAGKKRPPARDLNRPSTRKRPRSASLSIPSGLRRLLGWLVLLPVLVILYGVSSYFLVPIAIKDVVAKRYEHHLDRPVRMGRVVFSPFSLQLLASDISVGPVPGDRKGRDLLSAGTAELDFSLSRIWKGRIVCRRLSFQDISVNMVSKSGTIGDLQGMAEYFLAERDGFERFWPSWLIMNEVQIRDGRILVDDLHSDKVYSIEQIQLSLPSSEKRTKDPEAMPTLSAEIDSSPFEVSGVRMRSQSGAWRTGFSFAFTKVVLANFQEFLPFPETGFSLTEGEADIRLNVMMPEVKQGNEQIVIEGTADLHAVTWKDNKEKSELVLPEGQVVFQFLPGMKSFHLASFKMLKPRLTIQRKSSHADEPLVGFSVIHTILQRIVAAKEMIALDQLSVEQGTVQVARESKPGRPVEFSDLSLSLTNVRSAGYNEVEKDTVPGQFHFRARDISGGIPAEFIAEGSMGSNASLTGKLEITGLDFSRYKGLFPGSNFAIKKGIAYLSMLFSYPPDGGKTSRLYDGMFTVTDFSLSVSGKKALSGKKLVCRKFQLDLDSRELFCGQAAVTGADIYADRIMGQPQTKRKSARGTAFRVNELQVRDSRLFSTIDGIARGVKKTSLKLGNVLIKGTDLFADNPENNIQATATVGKKGKISLRGSYSHSTGSGILDLEIKGLALPILRPYFSPWLVPEVTGGTFSCAGRVTLPEKEFRGSASFVGLNSGTGDNPIVNVGSGSAASLYYRASPPAFEAAELALNQPVLKPGLSSGGSPVARYLRLPDNVLPAWVSIGRVTFKGGTFGLPEPVIYPGYQPEINGLSGSLEPESDDNRPFSLNGIMAGSARVQIEGNIRKGALKEYNLVVDNFSLKPFEEVLEQDAGLVSRKNVAAWKQSMRSGEKTLRIDSQLSIPDVLPVKGKHAVVQLLVGENQALDLQFSGEYHRGKARPFLFEQFLNRVRHLEVKEAISPGLALKDALPDMDLPEFVLFTPGTAELARPVVVGDYLTLLAARPYTSLGIQGQFDPKLDGEVLQAALQKKFDEERDIENTRRALEKIRREQLDLEKNARMKKKPVGVTEEILPADIFRDLEPIPRKEVVLEPVLLKKLAAERAAVLRSYFIEQLGIDPKRIRFLGEATPGGNRAKVTVLQFAPDKAGKEDNDS